MQPLSNQQLAIKANEARILRLTMVHDAASGHPGQTSGLTLSRAADAAKDQSYVLGVLTADQLAHCLFPLADSPSKELVRAEAAERVPATAATTAWGTPGLDLPGVAEALLRERGVSVATAGTDRKAWCTLEHRALYSYRRDTTPQRLAGLVWARNGRDTA